MPFSLIWYGPSAESPSIQWYAQILSSTECMLAGATNSVEWCGGSGTHSTSGCGSWGNVAYTSMCTNGYTASCIWHHCSRLLRQWMMLLPWRTACMELFHSSTPCVPHQESWGIPVLFEAYWLLFLEDWNSVELSLCFIYCLKCSNLFSFS